jgi:O-antigen/teichoic acid export membrane protein
MVVPPARARAIGADSFIYVAAMALQRGAAFLLLPLYTQFLSPTDYGILAVVTAINGFLVTLFSLSLHGAITRFYFEYRESPQQLREFWGTLLTFVALSSTVGCVLLLTFGERILDALLGTVRFWPYVALGIVAVVFQLFVTMFLTILQARGEAGKYALYSLATFVGTALVTIVLIAVLEWGATGALTATLVVSAAAALIGAIALRGAYTLGIRRDYLRQALRYCAPQIPHSLNSQVAAATDRMLLNNFMGRSTTGIYNVGAMFGMVVDVLGQGINRAYVPLSMDIMQRNEAHELKRLRDIGLTFIAGLTLLAATMTMFAPEAVALLTAPEFQDAQAVVPFIAFAGAVGGAYYVLISPLFYDVRAIRYLPLATLGSAVANVALNLVLIPRLGIIGAAIAALCSQTLMAVLVAVLARRFDPVRWPYSKLIALYVLCFVGALLVHRWLPSITITGVVTKACLCAVLVLAVSRWMWNDSLRLLRFPGALARSLVRVGK